MDNLQVKSLLGATRPGGVDDARPEVREAIAAAKQDPSLGDWLLRERALDAAVAAKLRNIAPPADLREAILRVQAELTDNTAVDILPSRVLQFPHVRWWHSSRWLAAAAVLLLFVTLAGLWEFRTWRRSADETAFVANMTRFLESGFTLERESRDVEELRSWLQHRAGTQEINVPPRLRDLLGLGCRILHWRGHEVTLLCFTMHASGSQERDVHLFTIDVAALTPAGTSPKTGMSLVPVLGRSNGWNTAQWTSAGRRYLVATHADRARLETLLSRR